MIGVAQREMQVVQHHDERRAALARERRQRVERGDLLPEIEVRRRLVEQHQRRVLRDERRERDAAPLAAGERAHVARLEAGEAEARERGARAVDVGRGFPLPAREMRMPADERGLEHASPGKESTLSCGRQPRRQRALARRERGRAAMPS